MQDGPVLYGHAYYCITAKLQGICLETPQGAGEDGIPAIYSALDLYDNLYDFIRPCKVTRGNNYSCELRKILVCFGCTCRAKLPPGSVLDNFRNLLTARLTLRTQ